jgi:glycosyltransferase involved in cell wall biosynthesis
MIHVQHIITSLNPGATEKSMLELALGLDPARFRISVISLQAGGYLADRLTARQVDLETLGVRSVNWPGLRAIRRLKRTVVAMQPDIVQGWMTHGNLAAWNAYGALDPSKSSLCWNIQHTLEQKDLQHRKTRFLLGFQAMVSGRVDRIVYQSEAVADSRRKLGFRAHGDQVISNGVDLMSFRPSEEFRQTSRNRFGLADEQVLIGFVAPFEPLKGHRPFLEAVHRLHQADLKVHALLVGEGADAANEELTRLLQSLGLTDHVHRLGYRSNIAEIFPAFDICCLASFTRSFPDVLAEAMACGVPCVASGGGMVADIIGNTGVVVADNRAETLRDGLRELLECSSELRKRKGHSARRRIEEQYSLQSMVEQYQGLYEVLYTAKRG